MEACSGKFGMLTLLHDFPSLVTCTRPFPVPAQITPAFTVESDKVSITLVRGLGFFSFFLSVFEVSAFTVRSGLISFQVAPPSFDVNTYCAPMYSACGSNGAR